MFAAKAKYNKVYIQMFTSNFVHVNTTVPLISALVKEKYARKKERRRKNSTKAYCLLIRKEMTNGAYQVCMEEISL